MKEGNIQKLCHIEASEQGATMFRNETFNGWVGKVIHKSGDQVTLSNAKRIAGGLCVGSSDLIGFMPTVITQDMVGQTLPVFTGMEVKTPTGKPSKEQVEWDEFLKSKGCISGVVRSPEDVVTLLTRE